jgi:hypothetical protein
VFAWAWVLAVLAIGLVLDSVGVPGAGWVALAAVAAMLVLFYLVPLFGPRRPKRSRE